MTDLVCERVGVVPVAGLRLAFFVGRDMLDDEVGAALERVFDLVHAGDAKGAGGVVDGDEGVPLADDEGDAGVKVETDLLAGGVEGVAVAEGDDAQGVLDPEVVRMEMAVSDGRVEVAEVVLRSGSLFSLPRQGGWFLWRVLCHCATRCP